MPEEEKEKKAAPKEGENKDEGKKGSSKKKMMIIGGIIFVVLIVQVGTAFLLVNWIKGKDPLLEEIKKQKEEKQRVEEERTKIGANLEEAFKVTVNLKSPKGSHYLKTTIQFEWDEIEFVGLRGQIEKRRAKILDIIINIMSTQDIENIYLKTGKQRIRENIKSDVNSILPEKEGQIINVLFQEFIIQ